MNYRILFSHLLFLFLFFSVSCSSSYKTDRERMDLSGYWLLSLDSTAAFSDSLYLPGTTDTNKKGMLNTRMDDTDKLSRVYTFKGKAWYRKTVYIPQNWAGRPITLFMERTKPSHVYVDGKPAGSSTNISTSQSYDLSAFLTPGKHVSTVMVDNGDCIPRRIITHSHLSAEDTQTNWNGIIGDLYLEVTGRCHISKVDVYPDFSSRTAEVRVRISGGATVTGPVEISCSGETWNTAIRQKIRKSVSVLPVGDSICTIHLDLGKDAVTWSEFHPALYRLHISLSSGGNRDYKELSFGLRDFKTKGTKFTINDKVTYLRGKADCCVFPLTGHTAMDVDTWRKRFRIAKQYGINHYRFHTWCPPEACFEAADIEGIYLQPELPFWGTIRKNDSIIHPYLLKEGINMQNEFANHASFVMLALGNELSGPQSFRDKMLRILKENDGRHLHSFGSNNGCGYGGVAKGEDYYTTCRVGGGFNRPERHVRASFAFLDSYDAGTMNHDYPNTVRNFDSGVARCPDKPVISHEIGAYQVYPNYEEMKKYTGVLEPRNFAIFKKRLEDAGMGTHAHDFLMASGKWVAEVYCAEMEMELRTGGHGGFQLLDLQDFPGQGTALVGVLDAFMDSKGLITPEEWRRSCSEVVLLFEFPSYTHSSDSNLQGRIKVANYSEQSISGKLDWVLKRSSGTIAAQGEMPVDIAQGTLGTAGTLDIPLSGILQPEKCTLWLRLEGTSCQNDYPVWVYPADINTQPSGDILVAERLDARTLSVLKKGGKVLLFPEKEKLSKKTVGGLFITDYWNYKMFNTRDPNLPEEKKSPGTMGLLMDPQHPLFRNFPTEFHSNWQWYPMVKEGYPMILDGLPVSYRPIIQVIDNMERNHTLGLVYEFNVEGGKLLVCMSDLDSQYKDRPEVKQFKSALLRYMESESFSPAFKLSCKEAADFFRF